MWKNYYLVASTRDSNDEKFMRLASRPSDIENEALQKLVLEDLGKIGCTWDGNTVECADLKELPAPESAIDYVRKEFPAVKTVDVRYVDEFPFEWVSDWAYAVSVKNVVYYLKRCAYPVVHHFVLLHELGHVVQWYYGREQSEGLSDLFSLMILKDYFGFSERTLLKLLLNMYRYSDRTDTDVYYENDLVKEYLETYVPCGRKGVFEALKNEKTVCKGCCESFPVILEYFKTPPNLIMSPEALIFADVLFGEKNHEEIVLPRRCKNRVKSYIHKYPAARETAEFLSKDFNVPLDCIWHFFGELSNTRVAYIDAFSGEVVKNAEYYSRARYYL